MMKVFNKFRYYPHFDPLIGAGLAMTAISLPLILFGWSVLSNGSGFAVLVGGWLLLLGFFSAVVGIKEIVEDIRDSKVDEPKDNIWFLYLLVGLGGVVLYAEYGPYGYVIHEFIAKLPMYVFELLTGASFEGITK